MSATTHTENDAHASAFIVYINGIEVPCKSVSQRFGVWQIPEMQLEMVADPVLQRLGAEDRAQVAVFYLDTVKVHPSVKPEFRLFGEGEITGWGYQNTPSGRSITFTVVNQFAIFTQLYVHFLTSTDDMVGYFTDPSTAASVNNNSSQIIFPFSLFKEGLVVPEADQSTPEGEATETASHQGLIQDATTIVRPFDFLYNCVKNMIGAQVPKTQRALPAANFFTRWVRLTNFHNRFMAMPVFDEFVDNSNIFPVLKALQSTAAVDAISNKLIPPVQNAGSIYDMLQLVFQTMFMEIAMIPTMPLIEVDLKSSLVRVTKFEEHQLSLGNKIGPFPDGKQRTAEYWTSSIPADKRKLAPLRIGNYFAKPQLLFGIPPACNVIFPSQLTMLSYEENYATQPTRMYFNDSVVTQILKADPTSGYTQAVSNVLSTAYPIEADLKNVEGKASPHMHGKNFLLFPEEFFKGPVMDRRPIPSWLFFLKEEELSHAAMAEAAAKKAAEEATSQPGDDAPAAVAPTPASRRPRGTMVTDVRIGEVAPNGERTFAQDVERLRPKVRTLANRTSIPEDFLLAWISHMTGGSSAPVAPNRRGPFGILGPHLDGGTPVRLEQTEAGEIGLTLEDTGTGINDRTVIRLSSDEDFALRAGVSLVQYYRKLANRTAAAHQLGWSQGDLWRLTKLAHGTKNYALLLDQAASLLERPPTDWEEFFTTLSNAVASDDLTALKDATGIGGVVAGATGAMADASGQVTKAPSFRQAPGLIGDVAAAARAAGGVLVGKTTPEQLKNAVAALLSPPESMPTDRSTPAAENEDLTAEDRTVYQLYSEYEFFRERYSRRSGSAILAWNPYIVPGFPAAIFDNRATRVDLCCYITSVQQQMSHRNVATNISFVYGRTFQEMFSLMRHDYEGGYNSVIGSAPREPIRDIRKVAQDFGESEALYQKLFYGNQRLYNKDAAFDFRRVIGYQPTAPTLPPEEIYITGPTEAAADNLKAARARLAKETPAREALVAEREKAQKALKDVNDGLEIGGVSQTELDKAAALKVNLEKLIAAYDQNIALADDNIRDALALKSRSTQNTTAQVDHNLRGDRELVPLPAAEERFARYDAAMKYNWRPICTLDEYIIFYDSFGEGTIDPYSHPRSAGARYYSRIRRLTPLTAATQVSRAATGTDLLPPTETGMLIGLKSGTGPNGQNGPSDFPQTRDEWDRILLAYRNNIYTVKAPRR